MRVRNPNTGTVLNLDTETANAYVSAGWEQVDAAPRRTRRTATEDTDGTSNADSSSASEPKTRRRRTSK